MRALQAGMLMLGVVGSAQGGERLPTIPPADYSPEQKQAAVEFEAVVLLRITSRPGVKREFALAEMKPGPNRNVGRPSDAVFVMLGVTWETVAKLSG